jgi:hypothetical protein
LTEMKAHLSTIHSRVLRKALSSTCRYRVVAIGLDHRHRLIGITVNTPRLQSRGMHAEERLMHTSPRSLSLVLIARVGSQGDFLGIDPCPHCSKLARRRGVRIERLVKIPLQGT